MFADRRQHLTEIDRAGPRRRDDRPLRPLHRRLARLPGGRAPARRGARRPPPRPLLRTRARPDLPLRLPARDRSRPGRGRRAAGRTGSSARRSRSTGASGPPTSPAPAASRGASSSSTARGPGRSSPRSSPRTSTLLLARRDDRRPRPAPDRARLAAPRGRGARRRGRLPLPDRRPDLVLRRLPAGQPAASTRTSSSRRPSGAAARTRRRSTSRRTPRRRRSRRRSSGPLAADASRLPYEGARRVLVLLDVDRTEAAAFSALLKVLEEPPSRARFVLTATRPRLLPPTILSRVVLRRLPVAVARRSSSPRSSREGVAPRGGGGARRVSACRRGGSPRRSTSPAERATPGRPPRGGLGPSPLGLDGLGARPRGPARGRGRGRDRRALRPPRPAPPGRRGGATRPGRKDGRPRRALPGPRPPRRRPGPGPPRGRRRARCARPPTSPTRVATRASPPRPSPSRSCRSDARTTRRAGRVESATRPARCRAGRRLLLQLDHDVDRAPGFDSTSTVFDP